MSLGKQEYPPEGFLGAPFQKATPLLAVPKAFFFSWESQALETLSSGNWGGWEALQGIPRYRCN